MRRLASCEVTYVCPFVDHLICSVSLSLVALRSTMPDKVDNVTPVAPSSTGNDAPNAVLRSASIYAVTSNVPAASSRRACPCDTYVAMPTSSPADTMIASLFDALHARAPAVPVSSPIIPSKLLTILFIRGPLPRT